MQERPRTTLRALLVKTYAAFKTGSSLNGRILAQTTATLDSATITQPHAAGSSISDGANINIKAGLIAGTNFTAGVCN